MDNWFITNPDASQQEVLKAPVNQNLIVKGAAGSGKTNMAIYRANQARNNTFLIVVYTVALKKMIRYGLNQLGLDSDRVIHEWSWEKRGIEITGDLFCITADNVHKINSDILILKKANKLHYFVACKKDDPTKSLKVSIDFDDWVKDSFYFTFGRRARWFKEQEVPADLHFNQNNKKKFKFIPSGFLFKEIENLDHVIVDEGQDFTLPFYSRHLIPKAQKSTTIFGDSSQKIYKYRNCDIEDIAKHFNFPMLNLTYNYRIPKTIAKIAQNIPHPPIDLITHNRKNNGRSDYPSFPKPIIKRCSSENDELHYIKRRIIMESLDDVAILLSDNDKVRDVHEFFSSNNIGTQVRFTIEMNSPVNRGQNFRKVDTLDFTNLDLPSILTFHSSKGTEFDNVFIPFAEDDKSFSRNSLYVAITRSSSKLTITYTRRLTSLLDDVNPNDVTRQ